MSRSRDLDIIAPDDDVVVTPPVQEISKKTIKTHKKIKTKSKISYDGENSDKKIYDLLGHTRSALSSFLVEPKHLKFAEQDEEEKIYLAIRPHWVTNLSWILISIIMLFVPLLFKYFSFLDFFSGNYQFVINTFWYLITFIYAFEKFLTWYFDLFLVTGERVVDIKFNNLLNKHFAEADLDMIQDVSSSVRGVMGTFFNYGDVLFQTASEINQITFEKVPNPEKIIKLTEELRKLEELKGAKTA